MAVARVAIGLGSNVGDRRGHLDAGRRGLAARGVRWTRESSVYETEPVGPVQEQGAFLNQVAVGETVLLPGELLQACLDVEAERGRERGERWGPRTLDLDILLYDDERVELPDLVLPHPELSRRAFVLVPLAEVAPEWRVPVEGPRDSFPSVLDLAAAAPDREGVRIWQPVTHPSPIESTNRSGGSRAFAASDYEPDA